MRKYKKVQFLTIIFVLFWFSAISIYLDYNSLAEADFLLGGFQFEVLNLENLLADKQDFHSLSVEAPLLNPFEIVFCPCILAPFCQEISSPKKPSSAAEIHFPLKKVAEMST